MHRVRGLPAGDVLVMRVHHCLADGIALVRVAMALTDEAPPAPAEPEPPWQASEALSALLRPWTRRAMQASRLTGAVLGTSVEILGDAPLRRALIEELPKLGRDALEVALMRQDSPTPLKGHPGGRKHLAWASSIPLAEVSAVCKALGVLVNDVLLSCVAGALDRYLQARGGDTAGAALRAMVPVNLRTPDEPQTLGNRFGLVPVLLPLGIADPVERLFEVHRRMLALKDGYQGPIAYALLAVLGNVPSTAQRLVLDYLAGKATAVVTNVPGPRAPIRLLGQPIEEMMFWVPQSGDVGLGVSLLSYAGQVGLGVIADTRICPRPQQIAEGFVLEFERLLLTLALLPTQAALSRSPSGPAPRRATPSRRPAYRRRPRHTGPRPV